MAINDTFSRIETASWGSTDSGEAWTLGGPSGDFSVSGGVGRYTLSAVNVSRNSLLASTSYPNVDITLLDVGVGSVAAGGTLEQGIVARYVDSSNFVDFRIFRSSTGVQMAIRQVVASVQTTTGFPVVADVLNNSTLAMRFQVIGSTLNARAWPAGEPVLEDEWDLTLATTHLSAGQVGISGTVDAGVTTPLPIIFTFDNFAVQTNAFVTEAQDLPFPEPSDPFCDGYLYTQLLAEAIDARLDTLDAHLEFVQVPQLAQASAQTPYSYAWGTPITYDTVDFDTNNLIDLSRSASMIFYDSPEREGRWLVGTFFSTVSAGSAGQVAILQQWATGGTSATGIGWSSNRDNGTGYGPRIQATGTRRVEDPYPNSGFYANYVISGTTSSLTTLKAAFSAWRFSD